MASEKLKYERNKTERELIVRIDMLRKEQEKLKALVQKYSRLDENATEEEIRTKVMHSSPSFLSERVKGVVQEMLFHQQEKKDALRKSQEIDEELREICSHLSSLGSIVGTDIFGKSEQTPETEISWELLRGIQEKFCTLLQKRGRECPFALETATR